MKIKRVETKNGRTMYFIDGKMKSEKDLPNGINLEGNQEIEVDVRPELPQFNTKACLFDQGEATKHKYLLGRTIGLCDDCYASKTTGQIAHQMS